MRFKLSKRLKIDNIQKYYPEVKLPAFLDWRNSESDLMREQRNLSDFFEKFKLSQLHLPQAGRRRRLTPYIGLWARLSQIWANKITLALIIFSMKIYLFEHALKNSLQDSQQYGLELCDQLQSSADKTALVPQYVTNVANNLVEMSIDESIKMVIDGLMLVITVVEELMLFMVEMTIGTYECLTVSLIDGSVDVAVNATESIISFTNNSMSDITHAIDASLGALTEAFDHLESLVTVVEDFFSGSDNEITMVNKTVSVQLGSFYIPSSINADLESLKNNVPTYAEVKNATEKTIKSPFELLKSKLSGAKSNTSFFDKSLMYYPDSEAMSSSSVPTFCSDASLEEVYHGLYKTLHITVLVMFAILGFLILLSILYSGYKEYVNWKWLETCVQDADTYKDPMVSVINSQSRFRVKVQDVVSGPFEKRNSSVYLLLRWLLSFLTTSTASTLLVLGVLGFLLVALQTIMLNVVENKLPGLKSSLHTYTVDFDELLSKEAESWQNGANAAINSTEYKINHDMLGWVQTGTEAINGSLTTFMDHMDSAISSAFSGTPLYSPVSSVVGCVIGNKVAEVEKAITWVHDRTQVSFSRVNASMLTTLTSLSSDSSNSCNTSVTSTQKRSQKTVSVLGSTNEDLPTRVVLYIRKALEYYRKSVRVELYVSTAIFSAWLVFLISGVMYCVYIFCHSRQHFKPTISNPTLQDPERVYLDIPRELSSQVPAVDNREGKFAYTEYWNNNNSLRTPRHFHRSYHSEPATPTSLIEDGWLSSQTQLPPFLGNDPFASALPSSGGTTPNAVITEFPKTPIELRPQRAHMINITVPKPRKSACAHIAHHTVSCTGSRI